MKTLIASLIFIVGPFLFGQNGLGFENTSSVIFGTSTKYYTKSKIQGSIFLFPKWDNDAYVYDKQGSEYELNNINFNIKRNIFQSKISKDSLLTFDFNKIEKIAVGNTTYKSIDSNGEIIVYEAVFESDYISLLKIYEIRLLKTSRDPMANRAKSKYVQKAAYLLRKDDGIQSYRLTKNQLLKFVSDKNKIVKIEQFVVDNELSYKNESDVCRILSFAVNI